MQYVGRAGRRNITVSMDESAAVQITETGQSQDRRERSAMVSQVCCLLNSKLFSYIIAVTTLSTETGDVPIIIFPTLI